MTNTKRIQDRLLELGHSKFHEDGAMPVISRKEHQAEWAAWRQFRQDAGLSVVLMDRQQTWTVPSMFPPPALLEMAKR